MRPAGGWAVGYLEPRGDSDHWMKWPEAERVQQPQCRALSRTEAKGQWTLSTLLLKSCYLCTIVSPQLQTPCCISSNTHACKHKYIHYSALVAQLEPECTKVRALLIKCCGIKIKDHHKNYRLHFDWIHKFCPLLLHRSWVYKQLILILIFMIILMFSNTKWKSWRE